jgi:hypothetical protein
LDLTEGMTARVAIELLRPDGRRREPQEQPCDYDQGEESHGYIFKIRSVARQNRKCIRHNL